MFSNNPKLCKRQSKLIKKTGYVLKEVKIEEPKPVEELKDNDSETDNEIDEETDLFNDLMDCLTLIKTKAKLKEFVKEYKEDINSLEFDQRNQMLEYINKQFYK